MALLVFTLAVLGHLTALQKVTQGRSSMVRSGQVGYLPPSPVLKIMALEFEGLFADFLFIKTISFYGERTGQKLSLQEEEWDQLISALETLTDLDPYFLDVYYFGETALVWDAGRVHEANRLLEKGRRFRTWDWNLPFFLGFNHFYFLQDSRKGASYLMEASRLPGSFSFLPLLAARLSQQAGQTEAAVLFLQELYDRATDSVLKQSMGKRLEAMKGLLVLERAVFLYRQEFGGRPTGLDLLVERGILKRLPKDPYGGEFYLDEAGEVRTTSRMVAR